MKKVFRRIAIALVLVTLALSMTACMGRTANTTPSYVNTYYIDGVKSDSNYVQVLSGNIYIVKTKDADTNKVNQVLGTYYVDGNAITLFSADGEETIATGTYTDNAWKITFGGKDYVKEVAASGCQASNWSTYLIFGILILAIIGLFIWSSISKKKQAKKAQETVSKLKVGDKVKTIGGICGFVAEIDDTENTFVLDVKSGDKSSYIKFDKGAIYQTAPVGNGTEEKTEENAETKEEKKD